MKCLKKSNIILLFYLFLGLPLVFLSSNCSAAEVETEFYLITEPELNQLEAEFKMFKEGNKKLQVELNALNKELGNYKLKSQETEKQLAIVNKSLQEFAKEEKQKRLRIKRQRNFYFCALIGSLAYIVIKGD